MTYVLDKLTGELVPKTSSTPRTDAPIASVKHDGSVCHPGQRLPLSRSLPPDCRPGVSVTEHGREVIKHADGTLSLPNGCRIVRNAEDARKHAESCGRVRRD